MVVILSVDAKSIFDSRKDEKEKTISVSIKTNAGKFEASSPHGKSKGKYESEPYKKNLETDIKTLKKFSDYFSSEVIEKFEDLRRIEDITDRHIGANTLFALESAVLKALAKEKKLQVWQLINLNAKRSPRLVGNCVGGGKHSEETKGKKPDFQEFLLIPDLKSVKDSFEANKKKREEVKNILEQNDSKFEGKSSDEKGWMTSLNDREVLDAVTKVNLPVGVDAAASGFYKRKKYHYSNPVLKRESVEQFGYVSNLIKNFNLLYIEDPFDEEDFESFAKLLKKFPDRLIVGDDLTVTHYKRLEKAVKMKSINAIIVKPNQCGSLLEVKKVCEFAGKNNIKIIFSHRSGETSENILADLAFGFGADFLKCGISGAEREVKIRRLIEIEKSLR